MPYGSILHIPQTNLLLLAAKPEPYKKAYLLTKNIGRIFWEKFGRMDQQAEEQDKTKRVIGLGRRRREQIVKWSKMTALRSQKGGRQQTSVSPASLLRGIDGSGLPTTEQLQPTRTSQLKIFRAKNSTSGRHVFLTS